MGFASDTEEVDLTGACLWIPASFRHDVETGHSRAVYGGVHILGIARRIDPAQMRVLTRQTTQAGQRLWRNKVWGDAANRYHASLVEQKYPPPQYEVKIDEFFRNPIARRYPDVTVLSKEGVKRYYEIKTGNAPVNRRQAKVDSWSNENIFPTELVRYPGCPVNLYDYAKYFL